MLYERPDAAGLLLLQAFLDPTEIAAFNLEAEGASPAERGRVAAEMVEQLDALVAAFDIPESPEDKARARDAFEALDWETREASVKFMQHAMMSCLPKQP